MGNKGRTVLLYSPTWKLTISSNNEAGVVIKVSYFFLCPTKLCFSIYKEQRNGKPDQVFFCSEVCWFLFQHQTKLNTSQCVLQNDHKRERKTLDKNWIFLQGAFTAGMQKQKSLEFKAESSNTPTTECVYIFTYSSVFYLCRGCAGASPAVWLSPPHLMVNKDNIPPNVQLKAFNKWTYII